MQEKTYEISILVLAVVSLVYLLFFGIITGILSVQNLIGAYFMAMSGMAIIMLILGIAYFRKKKVFSAVVFFSAAGFSLLALQIIPMFALVAAGVLEIISR